MGKFPDDECTDMLKNNFYVDNLVKTCNSPQKLMYLYEESVDRMEEGNFCFRYFNTNCDDLKSRMIADGNYTEHGCQLENVLGYRYDPVRNTLPSAGSYIDSDDNTKRKFVSNI